MPPPMFINVGPIQTLEFIIAALLIGTGIGYFLGVVAQEGDQEYITRENILFAVGMLIILLWTTAIVVDLQRGVWGTPLELHAIASIVLGALFGIKAKMPGQ